MLLPANFLRALIFFLLFLIIFQDNLSAQRLLRYQGPYSTMNYEGLAQFDYSLVENDTIFNGTFQFQQDQLKSALDETAEYFSIKGNMKDNIPGEDWQFTFGDFATENKVKKIDYTFRLNLSGKEHNASGNFLDGAPDGEWLHIVKDIGNAAVIDTLFFSRFQFVGGVPRNIFEIYNNNSLLAGRFLETGFAHDEWELYTTESLEAVEVWAFNEGRLEKITKSYNQESIQSLIYPKALNNPEVMILDSSYLAIVRLLALLSVDYDTTTYESRISGLLSENESYYQKINGLLNNLGEAAFSSNIKVKVEQYPLTQNEVSKLDSLSKLYDDISATNSMLNKNSQINILKLANEEVLFEASALNYYQEKYLDPLEEVFSTYKRGLLKFIPRDSLAIKLLPIEELRETQKFEYVWNDSIRVRNLNELFQTTSATGQGFALFFDYAEHVLSNSSSLQNKLSQRLETQERQKLLLQFEESLMQTVSRLNEQIDSLKDTTGVREQKALSSAKVYVQKALKQYSMMEEDFEKPSEAKLLTKCFSNIGDFAADIATIPAKEKEIAKLYTDDVFNPFTSTVMSEQVKTKLTDAYEEILIPFFLDKLEEPIKCNLVAAYDRAFTELHQKMKELRKADTNKLERKIQKADNAETILEMLGINIPVNQ